MGEVWEGGIALNPTICRDFDWCASRSSRGGLLVLLLLLLLARGDAGCHKRRVIERWKKSGQRC